MENIENKNITPKNIVLLLIGVLAILVAYKYISSGIDAQSALKKREPLNQCIEDVEKAAESNIKNNTTLNYTIFSESYKFCMEPTGHGKKVDDLIASGKMTLEQYCAPPTSEDVEVERQKIRKEEQLAKDECYKRYK